MSGAVIVEVEGDSKEDWEKPGETQESVEAVLVQPDGGTCGADLVMVMVIVKEPVERTAKQRTRAIAAKVEKETPKSEWSSRERSLQTRMGKWIGERRRAW